MTRKIRYKVYVYWQFQKAGAWKKLIGCKEYPKPVYRFCTKKDAYQFINHAMRYDKICFYNNNYKYVIKKVA